MTNSIIGLRIRVSRQVRQTAPILATRSCIAGEKTLLATTDIATAVSATSGPAARSSRPDNRATASAPRAASPSTLTTNAANPVPAELISIEP
jgi:hypothetical protein